MASQIKSIQSSSGKDTTVVVEVTDPKTGEKITVVRTK